MYKYILFIILSRLAFAGLSINESSSDKECLIPFQKLGFKPEDAQNVLKIPEEYRNRYIVGDFNTAYRNEEGKLKCRGLEEINPRLKLIEELKNDLTRNHFEATVGKYQEGPYNKAPVTEHNGTQYCIGQRILVCQISRGQGLFSGSSAQLVARFLTSSHKPDNGVQGLESGVYAPIGEIYFKAWETSRSYGPEDSARDRLLGGGSAHVARWKESMEMPNFMGFRGIMGYPFEARNGLHEKMGAEGSELINFIGAPVSLGCIRLNRYASKFLRWYLPMQARFFIQLDPDLYWKSPPR